jgi:hypothetical protein
LPAGWQAVSALDFKRSATTGSDSKKPCFIRSEITLIPERVKLETWL